MIEIIALAFVPFYFMVGAIFWTLGSSYRRAVIRRRHRALRKKRLIVSEYVAPPDLSPAEIGYLYDQAAGRQEYLATLFDLERRGYIVLMAGNNGGAIQAVATNKKPNDLLDFELDLYVTVVQDDFMISEHIGWYGSLWGSQFEYHLEKELEKRGLLSFDLSEDRKLFTPLKVTAFALSAFWAFLVMAYGPGTLMESFGDAGAFYINSFDELSRFVTSFVIVLVAAGLSLLVMPFMQHGWYVFRRAKRLAKATSDFIDLWAEIEGYRVFVELVELDEIQFSNKIDKEKARHEVLPYAIALNLSTRWEARFRQ